MPKQSPLIEMSKTAALALVTLLAMHFTLGTSKAQASPAAACAHGACLQNGLCGPFQNHGCCFSGGGCETISCLLSPDGCP